MTEEKNDSPIENPEEDVYVIDDTGESLADFDPEVAAKPQRASGGESAELARLREENQKLHDQVLRTRADFDNFRKRSEREKSDFFKYALVQTVRELLPVLDNFERAFSSRTDAVEEVFKGIEMIYKQFSDVLQKAGVSTIDTASIPFDPKVHESIVREENSGFPNNTVIEVLQKGYLLHDRLIRPALVRVAVGDSGSSSPEAGAE